MLAKVQKERLFFSFLSPIVWDTDLEERRNPCRRTFAKTYPNIGECLEVAPLIHFFFSLIVLDTYLEERRNAYRRTLAKNVSLTYLHVFFIHSSSILKIFLRYIYVLPKV